MAIKIVRKIHHTGKDIEMSKPAPIEETKKSQKSKKKSMEDYSDVYKEEFPALELEVDDTMKLVFSVKRGGDLGLPRVDIRQFMTTEAYTGFTKKGINFPLELLIDFIDKCQEVEEKSEEKNLIE